MSTYTNTTLKLSEKCAYLLELNSEDQDQPCVRAFYRNTGLTDVRAATQLCFCHLFNMWVCILDAHGLIAACPSVCIAFQSPAAVSSALSNFFMASLDATLMAI